MSDFDSKPVDRQGKEMNGPTVIAAGEHAMATTDEDIVIVGLKATDIVVVSTLTQSTTVDLADLIAICEADNLNIQASAIGDASSGVVSYIVVRP